LQASIPLAVASIPLATTLPKVSIME